MPEDDESQTELDKSGEQPTPEQDELLSGLPDDPAERTKELETRVLASAREQRRITAENERLARERDEQKTRGDTWYDEWNAIKSASSSDQPRREKGADSAPKVPTRDLAEFVGDEEKGYEKLATTLKKDFGLMSRDEFEAERASERTAQQRTVAIQTRLSEDFEDLNNPGSPLRKEAVTQFEQLEREHPNWDTEAIAELAVTRAARKIGVTPGKKTDKRDEGGDRARNAFGSHGRRSTGGKVSGQVDDRLRKAAQRTAGEALPDDVLKRVADTVAANQAEAARRGLR